MMYCHNYANCVKQTVAHCRQYLKLSLSSVFSSSIPFLHRHKHLHFDNINSNSSRNSSTANHSNNNNELFAVVNTEPRALTSELQRKIQTMKMRSYRKLLRISYKDHVTNKEVRAKIKQVITWRLPDHRKETPNEVVWSCLPIFRSG